MDLHKALQELADEIKDEIIKRLHSPIGINRRTGENTLIGSELEKSIDVKQINDNTLAFEIASYFEYIIHGWKRTGRFPGTASQFLKNINDWVRRKHVRLGDMTQSQIVYYLYKRMIVEGREIAPRPFINYDENGDVSKILPFLDEFFNKWADTVFEEITSELTKYFKQ